MEIRVFIVSLACLSCLVPPALGMGLMTKAAAAGVAKGAVVAGIKGAAIGAGVGLAAKGAVALLAKKALLGILLKGAVLKGAGMIKMKKAALKGAGKLAMGGLSSVMAATGFAQPFGSLADSSEADGDTTTPRASLMDIITGTARVVQSAYRLSDAAAQKTRAVYRVISAVPQLLAPNSE